jgi:hypothetical protein
MGIMTELVALLLMPINGTQILLEPIVSDFVQELVM